MKNDTNKQNSSPTIAMLVIVIALVIGMSAWAFFELRTTRQQQEELEEQAQEDPVPIIGVFDVKNKIKNNEDFRLIDVRGKEDYNTVHLPSAENIPINEFREGAYTSIPLNQEVVVMCYGDACEFSTEAVTLLRKNGHQNVHNMRAGIIGWQAASLPVVEASDLENPINFYKITAIPKTELERLFQDDAERASLALIDIRHESAFKEANIEGSINIPREFLEQRKDEIPRDKRLVIISQSGANGEKAAALLFDLNFLSVLNLLGGFDAWIAE